MAMNADYNKTVQLFVHTAAQQQKKRRLIMPNHTKPIPSRYLSTPTPEDLHYSCIKHVHAGFAKADL